MSITLEHRFTEFLKCLPDAEWLDAPEVPYPPGTRKADFLLNKRQIIAEIKSIKSDPQPKVDKRVDQHLNESGSVVFGTVSSRQLFKDQDESDRFHNRMLRDVTRNTEEMCRSANDQINQTSRHLGLDSTGLLIVLNESIALLDPGLVAFRVSEYLNQKPRRIDYCLLIFESHEVRHDGVLQNQMLLICGSRTRERLADEYMDELMQLWAEHNESQYIRKHAHDPAALDYRPKE